MKNNTPPTTQAINQGDVESMEDFHYLMLNDHYPHSDLYNVLLFTKDFKVKCKVPLNKEGLKHWTKQLQTLNAMTVHSNSNKKRGTGVYAREIDPVFLV